ncbi:hypothetical protein Tco_0623221 [Tanacetum coccineum]
MASQDARLSKFKADFKQQQSVMTNKINTVLKAITDRIAGALPSDTVKNPKLNTSLVLFARSYPTKDPQCSTHIHEEQEREGDPEHTNTIAYIKEQRDAPLLERKDIPTVDNLGPNKDDKRIEWIDVEEPLDLVNISEESVYESLIKEMPKIILSEDNYDRGCRKPSDLKEGFYRDTIKLGPEYVTGMDDEGEVTFLALGCHLEEIHVTWAHLEKKQMRLRTCTKIHQEVLFSESGDGFASIKRRRRDLSGDGVWILATASQCSRFKVNLDPSTW